MDFGFDEDQLAMRATIAALLDRKAGLPMLRQAWADPDDFAMWSLWTELAEMGVQGLMAPEEVGGSGMDWVAMALVLAEAGRVALPLPLLETAAVGIPLLVASGDALGILPSLVDGSAVMTVAGGDGDATPVPAASRADWFLIGGSLYGRDEVQLTPVESVDRTRDTAVARLTGRGARVGHAGDFGAMATAAVLIGLGRELVRTTVEYVKERKQFGVPVGSFQAVKHQLANAAMQVEFAAPTVWAAAWELSHPELVGEAQRLRSVSMAKAMASDAAEQAARTALQCHGAMGYTDEYHLHMWLKRVWCLVSSFGTARRHRLRLGRELGLTVGVPGERGVL